MNINNIVHFKEYENRMSHKDAKNLNNFGGSSRNIQNLNASPNRFYLPENEYFQRESHKQKMGHSRNATRRSLPRNIGNALSFPLKDQVRHSSRPSSSLQKMEDFLSKSRESLISRKRKGNQRKESRFDLASAEPGNS